MSKNCFRQNLLPLTTLIVIFSSGLFFYSLPQILYYGYSAILIAILLISSRKIQFNNTILFILLICILSIIFNYIPSEFSVWQRFCIFVTMITPISSLIYSPQITLFRCILFKLFLQLIGFIIILSFIGYISQLNIFYHAKTHTFRGLMIYCMVLGPYAGIATSYFITKALQSNRRVFYFLAVGACLICLLSGSRGALVALIGSSIYLIAILCKKNSKRFYKIILGLTIIVVLSSPFLEPYIKNIEQKQLNNIEAGGTFASRSDLFIDRINEFVNAPILGSGFASVNQSIAIHTSVSTDGKVEPGSSWLFILSSLGVFAFIAFIKLIIIQIYKIFKLSTPTSHNLMLIGSCMVLFTIHMLIEGYILSAGSFLFWGGWLTIGMVQKDAINIIKNGQYSIL